MQRLVFACALIFTTILFVTTLGAPSACAGSRVALVIGNGAYQAVTPIPNPAHDAADLSEALKRMDFTVKTLVDVRRDDMQNEIAAFGKQASGAEIAIIFFSGHGVEVNGESWLIPVDARIETANDLSRAAVSQQPLAEAVSKASKLGLVILDAGRDNPFGPSHARVPDRGFSAIDPTANLLLVFATRAGGEVADGTGRNSPFTRALLDTIETPGLEVRRLFAAVRDEVVKTTGGRQTPFVYGSLPAADIFLKPPPAKP